MQKKLGQHFLKDKSVLKKISSSLEIQDNDFIIEIGPGHGELTDYLAEELKNFKGKLVIIEKDKELAPLLRNKFASENTTIIEGDALKTLPILINCNKQKFDSYKLVGNIPYYITGQLFRIISELQARPGLCVFTIQKEVADRIIAKPPRMNLLSASVQIWADAKIIATIPPSAFSPPPKVHSAIIKIITKKKALGSKGLLNYYNMLHVIFKQPRKTILNNLKDGLGKNKKEIINILNKIGIDSSKRPQNLGLQDITLITDVFYK